MTYQQEQPDISPFSGIDLRAFWETLRLRWWVIPLVIGVSVGFLWAQESDLRTEPALYQRIETYEARDPTGVLASVGIDPASVRPFPDATNLLVLLQSNEVRDEVIARSGVDVPVSVRRTAPSFTLVDTLESDGTSSFVFKSEGTPTYIYTCSEPAKSGCEAAINAYVEKTLELRRSAFVAGLDDLKSVLEATRSASGDASLDGKLASISALQARLDVPMLRVNQVERFEGGTVTSVRLPTYGFGVIVGLLVAMLIILQLTYSDRKVRSARHVVRAVGDQAFLGSITTDAPRNQAVAERRAAVSLHKAITAAAAKSVRFIPLRSPLSSVTAIERLRTTSGATGSVTQPFIELAVADLVSSSDDVDVLVVRRNDDLRSDLVEAATALRRGGRHFGGVLLLD